MEPHVETLRKWIGRTDEASELLTGALVSRFNATFDRQFPTEDGAAAPVLLHFCLCQAAVPTADLGPDGHAAKGGFLPPVALPRRMWAASDITFHGDLRIGEMVTRASTIDDVAVKEGRSGTLCFVTVTHQIRSGGREVITDRQTIVYRSAETGSRASVRPAGKPGTQPAASKQKNVAASAPLLFRYSALTFNSHRIHYDTPHVVNEEGYPGLVVHGPLQATLLAQFAVDLSGKKLSAFRFRSVSPIFGTSVFTMNARDDAGEMKLWAASGDEVAMEAVPTW